MTATITPPSTTSPPARPRRRLWPVLVAVAVLAAGGLGAGLALALGGSPGTPGGSAGPAGRSSAYDYYRSVMGRFAGGPMMGAGGNAWMTGPAGYSWMMGGTAAPGWMTGGSLPGYMMGPSTDPGQVTGQLFADAPGPRVSPADATQLGNQAPAGGAVDRAANRITFAGQTVQLTVLASPAMPAEDFGAGGLTDPTIVVPAGARVSIRLINADEDMAHGLVVTAAGASSSWMPMMTATPAFSGAALWLLGESTSTGMHTGTITFTASTPGTYQYLCPVPGHAQEGMAGSFVVR